MSWYSARIFIKSRSSALTVRVIRLSSFSIPVTSPLICLLRLLLTVASSAFAEIILGCFGPYTSPNSLSFLSTITTSRFTFCMTWCEVISGILPNNSKLLLPYSLITRLILCKLFFSLRATINCCDICSSSCVASPAIPSISTSSCCSR